MSDSTGTLLAQRHLEGFAPCAFDGLHGELEGLARMMAAAGVDTSFEGLMGVTGSALRTHFYFPEDNPGLRLGPDPDDPEAPWGPRYAWASLRHNNYGHLEAAAYFHGGEVRPVEGLGAVDTWKLLRFEIDAGRPVLAYGLGARLEPQLVTGYRLEKAPMRQLLTVTSRAGAPVEVDITGRKPEQPGAFPREMILFRPGQQAPYRTSDQERLLDVLRWALGHARARRELVYEESRFFATGQRAFEVFARFVRELLPEELASPVEVAPEEAAAEVTAFCRAVLTDWSRARLAAATFLDAWAEPMAEVEGLPGGPEALRALADGQRAAGSALAALGATLEPSDALVDPQAREHLAAGLDAALERERQLVAGLGRALGL